MSPGAREARRRRCPVCQRFRGALYTVYLGTGRSMRRVVGCMVCVAEAERAAELARKVPATLFDYPPTR